ncbi:hypothetical protein HNR29_004773 [Rhizobium leguminosarum]|jgi:hypothetical protein|nr:hypothetical protein [Rhizobium leguminosarum]MBA9034210.1 hypothetical protein [Rhizobium leguminosarum]
MTAPMVRADSSLAVTTVPGSRVRKGAAAEPRTHPKYANDRTMFASGRLDAKPIRA